MPSNTMSDTMAGTPDCYRAVRLHAAYLHEVHGGLHLLREADEPQHALRHTLWRIRHLHHGSGDLRSVTLFSSTAATIPQGLVKAFERL